MPQAAPGDGAERLEFAGVTLANVAFLVLDDAQLEMPLPGGYKIDAIVGFPVLRMLDRITFEAGGRLSAEPVPYPPSRLL